MTGGRDDAMNADYVRDEQLALANEDERLPWLEAGDDDNDEGGVDTGRIFGFALLAALVLAILVGAIWWFGQRGPDPELVADGSTIAGPDTPYKSKPTDPGGRKFAEGNVAPAVGEGQSREGRIADAAPRPSVDVPRITPVPGASPSAAAAAPAGGGVAVQVGAYSSKAAAEAGWQKLLGQTTHLSGVSHRVIEGNADIGTVFRLQAMTGNAATASQLCSALKGDGVACQVK